jgi:hypothetical protein
VWVKTPGSLRVKIDNCLISREQAREFGSNYVLVFQRWNYNPVSRD